MTATPTPGRIPAIDLAARLRLIRHELDLTVEEFAALCGLKVSTYSTWENGARPRDLIQVVSQICTATGYSREWLMWGDGGASDYRSVTTGDANDARVVQPYLPGLFPDEVVELHPPRPDFVADPLSTQRVLAPTGT